MTTNAVRYPVVRVEDAEHGQSWDVLKGRVWGPAPARAFSQIVSPAEWREVSPFFTPAELACKGTGALMIFVPALVAYNRLREIALGPHSPSSAYRSPSHNRAEGGGKRSRHLAGAAFDIPRRAFGASEEVVLNAARALGFNGVGLYSTFVHLDFRARPAFWTGR